MKKGDLRNALLKLAYGGHISSITILCFALTGFLLLGIRPSLVILAIFYCMSQVVYSYNHYKEMHFDEESNPERTKHLRDGLKWAVRSLQLYFFALIVLVCLTNLKVAFLVAVVIVGGILYTDYFKEKATKAIPGFKNIYASLFFALSIFSLPLFLGQPINSFYLYFSGFVFVRTCINLIFCDIKDIESDAKRGLKTIPVLLGKNSTLYILHITNLVSFLLLTSGVSRGILPHAALALGFSVVYDLAYLTLAFSWEGKNLRDLSYIISELEFWIWPLAVLAFRVVR
jgi:4-hydroxybenzoate polyprenyltransferase